MSSIHPTAIIDSAAQIDEGVRIGPYCVIEAGVSIKKGTELKAHVTVAGPTTIGEDNVVYPYASLGQAPQDLKYQGEDSELIIGDRNQIRECAVIHRGTKTGIMKTVIGNDNLFMAHSHIAHDCIVGNHTIFANLASLAGHVEVGDYARLSGYSGVHQFCRIGTHAFIGAFVAVVQDAPPYMLVAAKHGEKLRTFGPNSTGLERAGFSEETIQLLKKAWMDLLKNPGDYKINRDKYVEIAKTSPEIAHLIEFIDLSERGIIG